MNIAKSKEFSIADPGLSILYLDALGRICIRDLRQRKLLARIEYPIWITPHSWIEWFCAIERQGILSRLAEETEK